MKTLQAITPVNHDGKLHTADTKPFPVEDDDQADALIAVGAAREVPAEDATPKTAAKK